MLMIAEANAQNRLINVERIPSTKASDICFVWAHGWMRTHADLKPIANQLTDYGDHYLLDLPGHADTAGSNTQHSIDEFLKPILAFIKSVDKPIIWVGHSFGCRVGSHMGKHCPDKIKALFLICPPFNRTPHFRLKTIPRKLKQTLYKILIRLGVPKKSILPWFASKDYLEAGDMRHIFVKWVNEDSSLPLKQLTMPVNLLFAENDDSTPPELSKYYKAHCKHTTSTTLKHFDHYSIISEGQHHIIHQLIHFASTLK